LRITLKTLAIARFGSSSLGIALTWKDACEPICGAVGARQHHGAADLLPV